MTKAYNRKIFLTVLCLSLLLNIITAGYFARKFYRNNKATSLAPPQKPAHDLDRNKLFEVLPNDSNSIVFLGNSLTQYFELAELFANSNVKNRGIHGDDIEGALKRTIPIIKTQPKKVFIELGVNDLDIGHTNEQLLANYGRLLDTLQKGCPKTKIYVQSLLPAENSSQLTPTYCSPKRNKEIVEVNASLQKLAAAKSCVFIDVHRQFVLDGQLNPRYSVDGLHLSGEGYLLWTKILKPFVEE